MTKDKLLKTVERILNPLIDLIYPQNCVFCKELLRYGERDNICRECDHVLDFIKPEESCVVCGKRIGGQDGGTDKICVRCYALTPDFDRCVSALVYEGNVKNVIYAWKYGKRPKIARVLAKIIYEQTDIALISDVDIIVSVPLHAKKKEKRGYNQAELLAAEFAELTGIAENHSILSRIRDTTPQSGLRATERRENVSGAFKIIPGEDIAGKSILLVDDIFTTGSTLNECARILKEAGARRVYCVTLATTDENDYGDGAYV